MPLPLQSLKATWYISYYQMQNSILKIENQKKTSNEVLYVQNATTTSSPINKRNFTYANNKIAC